MFKKTLLVTFLACMSIASSCFATTWLKMGTATEWWYSPEAEAKYLKDTGYEYYYDADSLEIYKDSKVIVYTQARLPLGTSIQDLTDKFEVKRYRVHFVDVRVNGNRRYNRDLARVGYYIPQTDKFPVTQDYISRGLAQFAGDALDAELHKGRYYLGNVLYKEFAPILDLPNLYGDIALTPKSLGLNWIKSTSEFGVFYDPKSVKAKGDSVSAKIYIWIPSINRIELMNGKFNYTKKTFKPSSISFVRISDGEVTDSYRQGLIPGLVGDKLHTFRFDEEEPITIASEFFKAKVMQ